MQKLTKLQEDFCKALESGKFPKTRNPAQAIGKWCVLGVACEVSNCKVAWRQQIDMVLNCIYEPKKKGARDESEGSRLSPCPLLINCSLYGPYGRIAREFIGSAEDYRANGGLWH